ncbi:Sporulation integral membrane protein YlbJ [Koleobacter methoxysyntrophicus]|uniref:Sporulation integral membrane protein YlbJ n=1 Tax=Koleobacter methoxysyntrophicus TaxID=2751313 RepID=A0A8A0RN52_9FIRM|nr:sporulation integral membrane protein YlbJ [Koleobacter methoxysyntrophicus]QSQ09835.1 Sporulation integral membrane protein YlbJ [Koleobacter methoxysyntrophicus]
MNRLNAFVLAFIAIFITISIVAYPEIAFNSALKGLDIWFNIVFPALLPFFIGSQLLMGLGVVHFMGVLLEPLMRPFFNVPGVGSFVMAMGLASGYPIGAMLTGKLRKQNLINKVEAERLMSFTNTADPLFMFGAVAVGMFHNQSLGGIISISHYISCLILGLLLRFYRFKEKSSLSLNSNKSRSIIFRAFNELYKARKKDGRPFGELLGDCIKDSVNTLLLIGGFIILFSVIINILIIIGFVDVLSKPFELIFTLFKLDKSLVPAVISGIFEITLGTKMAGEVIIPYLYQKVMIASAIIAWSGLSVHAQVASMISGTDISMLPYIVSRLIHAFLAALITYILMNPKTQSFNVYLIPVFATKYSINPFLNWLLILKSSFKTFLFIVFSLIIISFIFHLIKNINIITFKVVNK